MACLKRIICRSGMPIRFPQATGKASLTLAFAIFLLDVMGSGILVPVVPALVARFSNSAADVGLLSSFYAIALFFSSPILGNLSDRYGRRRLLLPCILGSAVAWLIFGLADALWVLFAARILDGLTGGNVAIIQAYIADISSDENRSKNFALIGTGFGIGFVVGPAIGGWLSHFGLTVPAFTGAAFSLFAAILGWFILPESLPSESRTKVPLNWRDVLPLSQLSSFMRRPNLTALFIGTFGIAFAMTALRSYFGVFAQKEYHLNPMQIGHLFVWLGVAVVAVQGGLVRVTGKYLSQRKGMLIGFISIIIGYCMLAMLPPIILLSVATTFIAIGQGLLMPLLTTQTSQRVGAQEQGAVLGARQSLLSICMIIAPYLAGLTADHLGHGAPFAMCVVILTIGLVSAFYFDRAQRQQDAENA